MKKTKFSISLIAALLLGIIAYAGILDRLQKALDKGEYEKVEKMALKSIKKDTLNPGANYYLSRLFLQSGFVRYDMDSSLIFINDAIADYRMASEDVLEDLRQSNIDSNTLRVQKALIADAAFKRSYDSMTVASFTRFLKLHEGSLHLPRATYIRDSLAFDLTQRSNTWQDYQTYFQVYPESEFAAESKSRYQQLLFKDYTKDDHLASYIRFLKEHPDTPFRREAERVIFERSTVKNDWDSYLYFLNNYPKTHLRKKIGDILYYLSKSREYDRISDVFLVHPKQDSLRKIHTLEKEVLFPTLEESKYGFASLSGKQVIAPQYSDIAIRQLCGNITSEWLEIIENSQSKIINRMGTLVLEGTVSDEIGATVKVVERNGKKHLHHASGFSITPKTIESVEVMPNGWIAFKNNYRWGLITPTGHEILAPEYSSIATSGPFIILEQSERFAVLSFNELAQEFNQIPEFKFDDYELIQDSLIHVFDGKKEGLMGKSLQYTIPLDTHEIYISGKFWYFKDSEGYHALDQEDLGISDQAYLNIRVNEGWIAYKNSEGWLLVPRQQKGLKAIHQIDSVKILTADAAYIQKRDTVQLVFQNTERLNLSSSHGIKVLSKLSPSGTRLSYIALRDAQKSSVLNAAGKRLFEGKYEDITLFKDSLFQVKIKGKVGLKTAMGETALNARYDVLDDQGDLIYLLKDGKIGCMDPGKHVIIPAEYESRMKRLGNYYAVESKGHTGLINDANHWVIPAQYDQLLAWNDTSCWTRTGAVWQLVDLDEKEPILENIQSVRPWLHLPDQTLSIALSKDGFGLLSNQTGEILPMQYNDIVNIGTNEDPVFFAEQHLKAAAFYVVTYFNLSGETIRSQAFRPEEYTRIYCDE